MFVNPIINVAVQAVIAWSIEHCDQIIVKLVETHHPIDYHCTYVSCPALCHSADLSLC